MLKGNNKFDLMKFPRIIGIIFVLILLLITYVISVQENNHFKTQMRGEIINHLSQLRSRLETETNRSYLLTRGLISHIDQHKNMNFGTFEAMSKDIFRHSLHIKSIGLAPGNKLLYVYPFNDNDKNLGLDFTKNNQLWPSIKKAIEQQIPLLDFPNNNSFTSITPIFIQEDQQNNENYWGLVQIILDFDSLVHSVGLSDLDGFIRIALHRKGDKSLKNKQIFGDNNIDQDEAVKITANIAGESWVLSGEPKMGWQSTSPNQYLIWFIWCSLGLLCGWMVTGRLNVFSKQKLKLNNALSQAKEAEKAKSDFIANISHEIRTPLNPIIGLTYLALKDDLSTQTKTYLNEIQFASKLLLKTIDSVMDYNKLEAGKLFIEKQPFSLNLFIESLSQLYSDQAKEKHLNFKIIADENLPHFIIGDVIRLGQVIGNLLSNAIKFTNNGHISLQIKVIDHKPNQISLSFVVKDTGIGMTQKQIDKLFHGFNQSDSSTTREYGGTGLGLSLSRKLIQLMGGEIFVSSIPDEGSQFSFDIEFELGSEKMLSENNQNFSSQSNILPQYKDKSIMLVEDNITNQVVVQNLLQDTGLDIYIANNGQEAVFMSLARRYDLILMDIQMPIMDGYEAAKTIRTKKRYKNIPIIAMTAHSSLGDSDKSFEAGMSAHITKPIDPDVFYKTIQDWLPTTNTKSPNKIETTDSTLNQELPGIDTKIGLKKVLQDQELYVKILHEFRQDHKDDVKIINKCLINNDLITAKNMSHAIKGSSGHIGAIKLSETASQLESDCHDKAANEICIIDFQQAFDEVMSGIKKLNKTKQIKKNRNIEKKQSFSYKEQKSIIQDFTDKLTQASPQARELIPQLKLIVDNEHEKIINEIEELVDTFDFDEASKLLKIIKKSMT